MSTASAEFAVTTIGTSGQSSRTAEATIPRDTQCYVVALRTNGQLNMNPGPEARLEAGAELLLICTTEGEQQFVKRYGSGIVVDGRLNAERPRGA